MKELQKENKVTILISALEERYKSIHTIRERVQSIGIWALGVMFGAGGWLLQSGIEFTFFQKLGMIIFIVVAYRKLRYEYLHDLNKGFKSQQKVAARIESTLGLFSTGVFDDESTSIYPEGWKNCGQEDGEGKFFVTTYNLLLIGLIFFAFSIIFSGCI
jgi:hypothetical protein